ncbi:hypothetical protein GPUN_1289 [Glaciecola punicea ACAM 611]|uniref:Uncharacterized protein n=1 Tax=Glaciecola punicea ACAM 611 TaxID=1121923 RepID=H5TAT6_9ALTE|nr:hypothetical protein GPUN_1289 [Glaciecola punicea ACAM 611]
MAFEPGFPKVPFYFIFFIGSFGYIAIKPAHESTDIRQLSPILINFIHYYGQFNVI